MQIDYKGVISGESKQHQAHACLTTDKGAGYQLMVLNTKQYNGK